MSKRKPFRPNQGEGDKASARKYNTNASNFVAEHKVAEAAKSAREFIEANPAAAARDEEVAKAGPHPVATRLGELISEGKAMFSRAATKVRERLGRKATR